MADYVRRAIAPQLVGIDAGTLEMLVGVLEIAIETRELEPEREDIVELLTACGFCTDTDTANTTTNLLFTTLEAVAEHGEFDQKSSSDNEDDEATSPMIPVQGQSTKVTELFRMLTIASVVLAVAVALLPSLHRLNWQAMR
jgi:hypothetical protein